MIYIDRRVDYGKPEEGTFGILTFGDFGCYTVEPMWADNKRRISCIPEGDYFLERHKSPKFGDSAIIYGGTVSKYPDGIAERNLILIHPANRSSDLEGCVGLGDRLGYIKGYKAVLNSRRTVAKFLDLLDPEKVYQLKIGYVGY
jgi:hypothetical protein